MTGGVTSGAEATTSGRLLTVEAAATWTGKGTTGVNWWLLELGSELSGRKRSPKRSN